MADSKRSPAGLLQEASLRRGRPPRVLADSLQPRTREYVRQANREGSHLTLEMWAEYRQAQGGAPNCSVRTLGRALDRWGFTFGTGTRSQHLKETDHVGAARHRYLRAKRGNRKGDEVIRPAVYLAESSVNKNHSNDLIWSWEEEGPWGQQPPGQGERLILMPAMTKHGWRPHAQWVFKSTRKTGDDHGQMHHALCRRWCSEPWLPNMPQHSLILRDNAPSPHARSLHSAPTARGQKEEIRAWFIKNRLPVREDGLKAALVEMLETVAPAPTYALDELASEEGHEIVRTPPYPPALPPLETCWAVVKHQMARKSTCTMAPLLEQLDEAFDSVTEATCTGLIKKVREVEDKYWREDAQLDRGQ